MFRVTICVNPETYTCTTFENVVGIEVRETSISIATDTGNAILHETFWLDYPLVDLTIRPME